MKEKNDHRRLFLHAHREASALANELSEESDQFRFLRASCFANLKVAVGLIMTKASVMWISIPFDLSSRYSSPSSTLYSFTSSYTVFSPISCTFSSAFCLTDISWMSLFILSLTSLLIIDLVWHFSFPWTSTFFILLKINSFSYRLLFMSVCMCHLYISVCTYHLPKWHMMSAHFWVTYFKSNTTGW